MGRLLILAAAAVALSGCGTTGGKAILDNLQGCERHYNGVVSAGVMQPGSFSGSVKIDCPVHTPAPLTIGDAIAAAPAPTP